MAHERVVAEQALPDERVEVEIDHVRAQVELDGLA